MTRSPSSMSGGISRSRPHRFPAIFDLRMTSPNWQTQKKPQRRNPLRVSSSTILLEVLQENSRNKISGRRATVCLTASHLFASATASAVDRANASVVPRMLPRPRDTLHALARVTFAAPDRAILNGSAQLEPRATQASGFGEHGSLQPEPRLAEHVQFYF